MLARLRRKFVLIAMLLTGTVLVAVLGSTLVTTYLTQRDIIAASLDHAVNDDLDHLPVMGGARGPRPDHDDGYGSLLALAVDVSEDGLVIRTSRTPVTINSSALTTVVNEALQSDSDSGTIPELHVAWKSRAIYQSDAEGWDDYLEDYAVSGYDLVTRVAIVDTSALDNAFAEQVETDAVIIVVALLALLGVSWALSSWALAPVQRAWDDQRRFVSDASHELKTPLAVIVANTDILLADEAMPQESRRWVLSTADEAAHMRSLVNDLLELARADEGASSGVMRKEDVDLSDLVESAALEFDAVAFERGCIIESSIQPNLHVKGDPEWLERLAKILLDNACKYAAPSSTIDVNLAKTANHITLAVTNMGNVIDPEDLAHVFDRFYRSDKARNRATGGVGLGLAIAKGIAEAHGGTISATSTETDGTTFTVTL